MSTRFDDSLHLLIISKIISGNIKVEEASMLTLLLNILTHSDRTSIGNTPEILSIAVTIEDFTV